MRVSFAAGIEGIPYAYRLVINGDISLLSDSTDPGAMTTTWYIVDDDAQPNEAFVNIVADAIRNMTGVNDVVVFRVGEELVT